MRYFFVFIVSFSILPLGCNAQDNEALWPSSYCNNLEANIDELDVVADSTVYVVVDTTGHVSYDVDMYRLDHGMKNRPQVLLEELPIVLCKTEVDKYYLYNVSSALYSLGDAKWLSHLMTRHICSFEVDDRTSILDEIKTFDIHEWENGVVCN